MKRFLVLQNIWLLTAAALAVVVYVIACFALMEFLTDCNRKLVIICAIIWLT